MTFSGSTAQDKKRIESIVLWLDEFQRELERLRKPERAEQIRAAAHALAVFYQEFFTSKESSQ